MRHLQLLLLSAVMTACGGGSDSAPAAPGTQHPGTGTTGPVPQSATAPAPAAGDYYTYRSTIPTTRDYLPAPALTPEAYLHTFAYASTGGELTRSTLWGAALRPRDKARFTAAGALTAFVPQAYENCAQTYTPAFAEVPATVTVGASWETAASIDNSSPMNCRDERLPATIAVKGSAVGTETVQVPAGTFNTIKLVYQTTLKRQSDTVVTSNTCWRDVVSGMNVRCETSTTTTSATAGATTVTGSEELLAYATAATGKRKNGVERFAGTWKSGFLGSGRNNCELTAYATGEIKGTCRGSVFSPYLDTSGRVDANGGVTITAASMFGKNDTFTGKAADLFRLEGSGSTGYGEETWWLERY